MSPARWCAGQGSLWDSGSKALLDFALDYCVQFGETIETDIQNLEKRIVREGLTYQQRGSEDSLQMLRIWAKVCPANLGVLR